MSSGRTCRLTKAETRLAAQAALAETLLAAQAASELALDFAAGGATGAETMVAALDFLADALLEATPGRAEVEASQVSPSSAFSFVVS